MSKRARQRKDARFWVDSDITEPDDHRHAGDLPEQDEEYEEMGEFDQEFQDGSSY